MAIPDTLAARLIETEKSMTSPAPLSCLAASDG